MATLEERVVFLAKAIGSDVKGLSASIGKLNDLATAEKTSLVGAINELASNVVAAGGSEIDDGAASTSTNRTYSAAKITSVVSEAITALVGGAPELFDTLKEIADELAKNPGALDAILAQLENKLSIDKEQTLTAEQKAFGLGNLGAVSQAELAAATAPGVDALALARAIQDSMGDVDHDFAAEYAAAKL